MIHLCKPHNVTFKATNDDRFVTNRVYKPIIIRIKSNKEKNYSLKFSENDLLSRFNIIHQIQKTRWTKEVLNTLAIPYDGQKSQIFTSLTNLNPLKSKLVPHVQIIFWIPPWDPKGATLSSCTLGTRRELQAKIPLGKHQAPVVEAFYVNKSEKVMEIIMLLSITNYSITFSHMTNFVFLTLPFSQTLIMRIYSQIFIQKHVLVDKACLDPREGYKTSYCITNITINYL